MPGRLKEFIEDREAVLSAHLDLARDPVATSAWQREIELFRSLTDQEATDLEQNIQLPRAQRIAQLSSRLGLSEPHCESLLRGVAAILGEGLSPGSTIDVQGTGLREFTVDLRAAATYEDFVQAFNRGFCVPVGGHRWKGDNWNAFADYLSWPTEDRYKLRLPGFKHCRALNMKDRRMIRNILRDNPHVIVLLD